MRANDSSYVALNGRWVKVVVLGVSSFVVNDSFANVNEVNNKSITAHNI